MPKHPVQPRRKRHRSIEDKAILVGAIQGGQEVTAAASQFGFPLHTTQSIWAHYQTHGTVQPLPRKGRPRKLDNFGEKHIVDLAVRDPQHRCKPF
jgi:transposase